MMPRFFRFLISALLLTLLVGCSAEPVTIGFIATLSGRYSQLGVSCREGFLLAVQEFNDAGGINGTPVDVDIRNNEGNVSVCSDELGDIFSRGAAVVVGPMMSSMEPAVRDVIQDQYLVVSPTMATDALSGLDDFFIRFTPNTGLQGQTAASLLKDHGLTMAGIIFDSTNAQYSSEVATSFQDYYEDAEHHVTSIFSYHGTSVLDVEIMAKQVLVEQPDAVMLITSGTDAAILAQAFRKSGYEGIFIGSLWTRTAELLDQGAGAVEGMYAVGPHTPTVPSPSYKEFVESFRNQYSMDPDFGSILTYEATRAVLDQMKTLDTIDSWSLKNAMKSRSYQGLQGDIHIDRFGDARSLYGYTVVEDGQFVSYQYEVP